MREQSLAKPHAAASISPEFRLLAACSWVAPEWFENLQRERVRHACGYEVPWDRFLSLVAVHGVQPQAYETLRKHGEGVPQDVLGRLREHRVQISAASLHQAAELARLAGLFAAEGIDLLPLKGVVLSQQLYDDPGMRVSGDLDLMVQPDQCEKVGEILEREGYRCEHHGDPLTQKQKEYIRRYQYHLEYFNDKKHISIELHWNLGALWLPGHLRLLWENSCAGEWAGQPVRMLDPDILLLTLCDHGARHRFCCLKWLSDVARLLAMRSSPDMSRLLHFAELFDLKRTLAHTALLAHWVYGLPLDRELARLADDDPVAVSLSRKVFRLMTKPAEATAAQRRGDPLLSLRMLRLRPSIPLHRVVRTAIIAPTDFMHLQLPDGLFWLYAPLRPVFWLWRYFSPVDARGRRV